MTPSFLATDAKREIMPSLLVFMVKGEWEVDRFFRRNKALPKMNAKRNIFTWDVLERYTAAYWELARQGGS